MASGPPSPRPLSSLALCPTPKQRGRRRSTPQQVLLAKLEALTGTAAASQSMQQYQEMYSMREAQAQRAGIAPPPAQQQQQQQTEQQEKEQHASKKQKSGSGGESSTVWKAGLGYGHCTDGGGPVWDAVRAEMVQVSPWRAGASGSHSLQPAARHQSRLSLTRL